MRLQSVFCEYGLNLSVLSVYKKCKKKSSCFVSKHEDLVGGEGEIRTLERFYPLHDFQSCALDQARRLLHRDKARSSTVFTITHANASVKHFLQISPAEPKSGVALRRLLQPFAPCGAEAAIKRHAGLRTDRPRSGSPAGRKMMFQATMPTVYGQRPGGGNPRTSSQGAVRRNGKAIFLIVEDIHKPKKAGSAYVPRHLGT